MRLSRILAFSAFALLAGHAANATTYFDSITGVTPYSSDHSTVMGESFTAASADFTAVQLSLTVDPNMTGSATVYLLPDIGGAGDGTAAGPDLSQEGPSTQIGVLYDSSFSATVAGTQELVTFFLSTSLSAPDNEYWIVLSKDADSTIGWEYNADNTAGIGLAGQAVYYDGTFQPLDASDGPYQMIVDTPEPGALAILGAGLAALGFARRRTAA